MIRALLLVAALCLAGCASSEPDAPAAPDVVVPEGASTAGVDQAIVSVAGATVSIVGQGSNATTNDIGQFSFGTLPEGTYFLEASHPFYDQTQVSVTVGSA